MAEFQVQSIMLPPVAGNGDFSNWFEYFEPIGFNKVYYNDVLQTDRMIWKDTNLGLYLNGMYLYLVKFRDDHSAINVASILTVSTTATVNTGFFYRYMGNTNNILFGMSLSTTAAPAQALYAAIVEPEDENDVWSAFTQSIYMGSEDNSYRNIGNTQCLSYISSPVTAVALCPFWFSTKFKTKVFHVPIMPTIPVASIFKTQIGDKVYLVNDWCRNSRFIGIAFDITEEFE